MNQAFETHVLEYQHDGKVFILELPATSQADLLQRIERMRDGKYLGVLQFTVPASMGFFAKTFCSLKNLFTGRGRVNRLG